VEHLFLAIIQDRDAVPAQSLAQQTALAEVEAHLLEIMASPGYRSQGSTPVLLTSHGAKMAARVHAGLEHGPGADSNTFVR
jgi:hypothetical protein